MFTLKKFAAEQDEDGSLLHYENVSGVIDYVGNECDLYSTMISTHVSDAPD